MDRVAQITLIQTAYTYDSIKQQIATETEHGPLLCDLYSPTREEWNQAGQQGLKAQWMVKLHDSGDYEDEQIAELNGTRYAIYRTYLTDDGGIELYLRQDVGVNE